jgi:hypothetical protein
MTVGDAFAGGNPLSAGFFDVFLAIKTGCK